MRASFGDRAAWRAVGYFVAKVPLTVFGVWFALSVWVEALLDIASPLTGGHGDGEVRSLRPAGRARLSTAARHLDLPLMSAVFVTGVVFLLIAPWAMRLVVYLDRRLMHLLLGPDAAASRVRSLEESRSKTLDAATETLRRIERNLHDGTQAQLVALAMRLGQAKEKLEHLAAEDRSSDLEAVRRLVDDAHRGAKDAITDLRDLARGIHPPALDTGLENALATLAARSPVPTDGDGVDPGPAQPGHRDHRLLLRRRAARQRRPARPGVPRLAELRPARPLAADRGARQRAGRRRHQPGRLILKRPGRPRRPGRCRRREPQHRQPPGRAHRRNRRPALSLLTMAAADAIRVVIAEDSAILRDGLVQLLTDRGFAVIRAVSDAVSLEQAVAADPPDVAVVDIRMPPTFTDEGLRAAIGLRRTHPGVGILVFSQYVETRYAAELLAGGAAGIGYLLKDRVADVADFVEALVRVASGGTALDPEVVTQLMGASRRSDTLAGLSGREREVLALMAEGRTNSAIAASLVISEGAVGKHVANIFSKLDLPATSTDHRRVLAVLRYLEG